MISLDKNTSRNLVAIIAVIMAILIIAAPVGAATASLNLPSSLVNVIVQNDTSSYFLTTLSNVPSGFDVTNSTYAGWCIDHSVTMTRNETYEAQLYSSLNPPSGNFSSVRWDLVNYILNHKKGDSNETQNSIWFFVNNSASYTHNLDTVENATVEDALANGTGFIPSPGQSAAVIVYPQVILPGSGPFQDSIIEAPMPQPLTVNATVTGSAQLIGTNLYHMDSGASATFTANVQGGIQPYTYTWYINGTSNSTTQAMTFTPPQTGTYTIYVNIMDSSNPPQQTTSTTYTVTVPEYPLFAIILLAALTTPLIITVRRKKNKA
jgi:hypothetical protein